MRVSTASPVSSACSGLMYSGVPIIAPSSVNIVRSVRRCAVAFATPKSMIFGTALSPTWVTSTLEGFKSRWMIPF